MRHPIGAVFVIVFLMAAVPGAHAYKGFEHRQVSRDALQIALDHLARPCSPAEPRCCGPLPLTELDKANLRALQEESASNISYGDAVAFVDYVLDPIKLLEKDATITGLPGWPKDLNEDFLFRLRSRPTLHAFAAQGNDSHFQSHAMMSWWLWHRHAVFAAAHGNAPSGPPGSERLFSGLFMNAISNHYLQDSFAPGHVVTPREGMHDASAISMHDYYNRVGADFSINANRWNELAALIDPAAHAALFRLEKTDPSEAQTFLDGVKANGIASGTLKLRGDGYLIPSQGKLDKNKGLAAEARDQRLFLTLMVARTIVDVLESYACGTPVNSFENYGWAPPRRSRRSGKPYLLARASYPYGEYKEESADTIHYGILSSLEVSSQSTVLNDVEDTRGIVTAVLIPTSLVRLPPPGMNVDDVYVPRLAFPTLALGLSYRMDDELPGFGAFARVSLLSPRLDLNAGLAFGVERYTWSETTSYRFHPEIRVGVGASLVMLFGAVGYDHALDDQGDLKGSLTVRSGVQIGIPWSKIPRKD